MNTSELKCLLERALSSTACRFLGVFAADEAPAQLSRDPNQYPCTYVINTDVASQPGRHWVACFASSPDSAVEFFDSYGKPHSVYPNIRMPTLQRRVHRWSTRSFQSPRSLVCGHYCVFYICKRASGWSRATIARVLMQFASAGRSGLPYPQDRLVRRFVRNMRTTLPCIRCCTNSHRCSGSQCCVSQCRQ
jgi:hypothetical protein